MITLGIDPSLTGFGWCVHNSAVLGKDRVVAKGVFSTTREELFVSRYITLRSALVNLLEEFVEVEGLGVESPPYGEQFSEGLYALFIYVNEAIYLSRKNVVYFDPKSLKMLAKMDPKVRRGTMDKIDMVEAVKAETGLRLNHNEADAYLIARSAARFWEFQSGAITAEELTPSETRSFYRVHTFMKGEKAGQTERRGLLFREDDRFFLFSQVPPDAAEEEFRSWLSQRGSQNRAKLAQSKINPQSKRRSL